LGDSFEGRRYDGVMLDLDGADPEPERARHEKRDLASFQGEAARFKQRRKERKKRTSRLPRHLALWLMLALLLLVMIWVTCEKVAGPGAVGALDGPSRGPTEAHWLDAPR
jgi:hypothetical protein